MHWRCCIVLFLTLIAKLQADAAQARQQLSAVKAFASPKRGASRPVDGHSKNDVESAGRIRAVWPRSSSPASRPLQIVGRCELPRPPRHPSWAVSTADGEHDSIVMHRREVGATLHVVTTDGEPASHNSALQWLRQVAGVTQLEVIAGAVRCQACPRNPSMDIRQHGRGPESCDEICICALAVIQLASLKLSTACSTRRSPRTRAAGSPCAAMELELRDRPRWLQALGRSRWRKVCTDAWSVRSSCCRFAGRKSAA